MRRSRLAAAAGATLVVVGASAVALRAGGGDEASAPEPQIREELLEEVVSSPECPNAPEAPEVGDDEVAVDVVRVVDACLAYSTEVVAADELDARLDELRADPEVVAADDAVVHSPGVDSAGSQSSTAPGGPRRPVQPKAEGADQWALEGGHLDGENVRSLWPAEATEVRVAIIDSGIDPEHEDLAGQVVESAPWVHRYTGDNDSHGTHVAGIVAAAADGSGVMGLTPAVRLMDVQYYDGHERLAGPSNDLGEYVRWAVDHGADVINMSIQASEHSDTELTSILYAEQQGVVVVGISGNCGSEDAGNDEWWRPPWNRDVNPCEERHEVKYPAGYAPVLSVAAHTEDNERADFSSANASVDVAAPGAEIVSTCLSEQDDRRRACESSGTSQAAPFVSATAALLVARHPDAKPAAIRDAITESARTDDRQPLDSRTDEFGWGLLDPGAAVEHLDAHPGAPQPDAVPLADRTQVAYFDQTSDQVFVLDDGIPHPVRQFGPDDWMMGADFSADHTRLVAAAGNQVFSWEGPGSTLVEAACPQCTSVAYLDRPSGDDLIARLSDMSTITLLDIDSLEPSGTVEMALPAPSDMSVLMGDTGEHLLVAHESGPEVDAADVVSLIDPLSGEVVASHRAEGSTSSTRLGEAAVDAAADQVAYVGGRPGGPCGVGEVVHLLEGDDLGTIVEAEMPASSLGVLEVDTLFFNGDRLYATLAVANPHDGGCTKFAAAGVWRLDAEDGTWEQVNEEPLTVALPVEGVTGPASTGMVASPYGGDPPATFRPTGQPGSTHVQLGELSWVEATPTRAEVDLSRSSSTPPIDDAEGEGEDADRDEPETEVEPPAEDEPPANTPQAAIARYEAYLHALAEGDVDTMCEIARPAMEEAEAEGVGPCAPAFGEMRALFAPAQLDALRTATVDPDLVTSTTPGVVEIPAAAVVASVTFADEELGRVTLAFQDGDWFIVE